MTDPGVEVRPLRQITGEAEFNEVFLTDVRIPDSRRLGEVGEGWRVAQTTLMNERVAIGGGRVPREGGMIGPVAETWRERPELRTHDLHQRLLRLWVEAEAARLAGERLRQQLAVGPARPRGLGHEARLRPAQPGDQRPGGRAARRGGPALRRLDACAAPSWSTSPAATPATATCAPRATPSRAAPPRSCSTSSPSASSGLPAEPRTDKDVAVEGPAPMSTTGPALLRGRGRSARRRRSTCSTDRCDARRPCSPAAETGRPYDPDLWRTLAAEHGPGRAARAREARRPGRHRARGRRRAGGAGPGRRPGAVPDQRRRSPPTALLGCDAGEDAVARAARRARRGPHGRRARRAAGHRARRGAPAATVRRRRRRRCSGTVAARRRRGGRRCAARPRRRAGRTACTPWTAADAGVTVDAAGLARPDPAARRRSPSTGAAGAPARRRRRARAAVDGRCWPAPDCSPPSSSASPSGA